MLVGVLAMGGLATWSMLQTEQQFSCRPVARRTELKRESKQMYSAVYDMGGVREWFGPIPVEADEPVFHHRWEARVFVSLLMACAMLGISEDAFRWAMERLPERSTSPATTSGGSPSSSNC